jgi:hypothetical protein
MFQEHGRHHNFVSQTAGIRGELVDSDCLEMQYTLGLAKMARFRGRH